MTKAAASGDRPRVIVAAPNHWTSVLQVGTHHIARAFVAEGWDVAYLSDPISPFHLAALARPETRQRVRLYLRGGQRTMDGRLFAYVPGAFLSPRGPRIPGMTAVAHGWPAHTLPALRSVLSRNGFGSVDLVWVDSVIWEPLLDLVTSRASVLRIADRAAGFDRHEPAFDAMERRLAKRVDLVAYAASTLEPFVRSLTPRSMHHMPNGVDLRRFRDRAPLPPEYATIPSPRVVYVGAIAEWFDFTLVSEMAREMPKVSFVLIGPDELARRRVPKLANLHLLGRRPPPSVPALLQHAHVGLIPFDITGHAELVSAIHPLKLYEYVAAGLPVVAARWPELEALRSPAEMYETSAQAHDLVRAAIAGPHSPADAWLAGTDWADRVRDVLQSLFGQR